MMEIKKLKPVRYIVPFAVSALILYLLFSRIDIQNVSYTLRNCEIKLLLLAVLVSLSVNILFGAAKWRRILSALGCALPYSEVLSIRTGCILFKLIFPLKSYELLKALYLDRQNKLSFTRSVSSLVLDKALNLFVILCMAFIGLMFADLNVPRLIPLIALLLVILLLFSSRFRSIFIAAAGKIHPKLHDFTQTMLSGFEEIGIREKIILIVYSIIYQSSEFINTFILLKAVGITVPFLYLLVIIPVVMIINNLPVTILGLGTREASIVFFLSKFGTSAALLSGSILISFVEHILPVVAGIFFIQSFYMYFTMKDDVRIMKMENK